MNDHNGNHNKIKALIKSLKEEYKISTKVLNVLEKIPRDIFVPEEYQYAAYENHPLPIGYNQTISQPYIVAKMTELLITSDNHSSDAPLNSILEIGTGSGYQAAILSLFYKEVYTIERILPLKERAERCFKKLHLKNIHAYYNDGTLGLPQNAPFDAIILTAATPEIPKILLKQLSDQGGKLLLPIGEHGQSQRLQLITKKSKKYTSEFYDWVTFVPLLKGTD